MQKQPKQRNKRSKASLGKLTFHKLNWLEYVSIGLGFWFIFYPYPYKILFTVLLCMPILGLLLNGFTGRPSIASLVEISKDEHGRDEYDVADFIDFPAWAILIRVVIDYEFESFYSMLLPVGIAFVLLLLILFATHRIIESSRKSKVWIYFSLIGNVLVYSFAGTYGLNCIYDDSEPIVYDAEVVEKRISVSRKGSKRYLVKVTPWGHHYDREEISVAEEQYEEIIIGETVLIDYKEGLFNIPWYYIE